MLNLYTNYYEFIKGLTFCTFDFKIGLWKEKL